MRRLLLVMSASCLVPAMVAHAAPQPQQSVQDFECKYSGDCGKDAARDDEPTQAKGPTKGFSLSRPGSKPAPAVRPQAASGRSLASKTARAPRSAGVSHGDLMITFASGSTIDQGIANARAFAEALQRPKLAGMRFMVVGHTDAVGTREANLDLSRRRADAVPDFLVQQGVARERLQVEGHGFDDPLPHTSPKSAINRRVEAEKI